MYQKYDFTVTGERIIRRSKSRENEKIPTRIRETVRFLEISMERTFILDFSPYRSHIMYIDTQLQLVSTSLEIESGKK